MTKLSVEFLSFNFLEYQADFATRKKLFKYMIMIVITRLNILNLSNFLNYSAESDLVNISMFI